MDKRQIEMLLESLDTFANDELAKTGERIEYLHGYSEGVLRTIEFISKQLQTIKPTE